MRKRLLGLVFVVACTPTQPAMLAPNGMAGALYYAPFPHEITLDGRLNDWALVPKVTFNSGIVPPTDPKNGAATFACAANTGTLYCMADVLDSSIVAGQHGTRYWEEDSVEFYINASGDLNAKAYKPGVAQITVPAVNIGKKPSEVVLAGNSGKDANAQVAVAQNPTGYAVEIAIPLKTKVWEVPLEHQQQIGFTVRVNNASSVDKPEEVILGWAKTDLDRKVNASNTPSVFGRLEFFKIGSQ